MTVIDEIAAERRRQIDAEGWTPEHDDGHDGGEMLTAAWCYMQRHADADMWGGNAAAEINSLPAPARWPWDREWWKPKNRRRDLIRAAALIVAEIERLDRIEARKNDG